MVHVVITGGAGFLGSRLARELLAAGSLGLAGGAPRPLTRVTLIDRVPVPTDLTADWRVSAVRGELGELLEPGAAGREALVGAEVIFHLAAAVSGECEADFDLGMRANLRATESLLACCRAAGNPVVVFASSLAVFGASAEHPLPGSSTITPCPARRPATAHRSFVSRWQVVHARRMPVLWTLLSVVVSGGDDLRPLGAPVACDRITV